MRTTADQLAAVLDRWQSGQGPLYHQLSAAIVALAESGSLEHGARLPSERALAQRLHVSRNTVTAAYQHLRDQGWLEVSPGSAPRLGAQSRGAHELSAQARFAQILPEGPTPLVNLSAATPDAAPVVVHALENAAEFLGSRAVHGTGYAAMGDPALVSTVANHLTSQGLPADPEEMVITAGGQQAVWLAITALAGAACPVALESVTYPGVFDAVLAAGSRSVALPMTDHGLDVDASIRLLRAVSPDVAYLTTYQNPTGTALSEDQATALVQEAARLGTTLIDDRTIGDLTLSGDPPPMLATLPGAGPVVTIGGLSKVFWGGLRVGWLHTNPTLAAQLRHRRAAMDLGGSAMIQHIGEVLLREHFESTVAWRVANLHESLAATEAAMASHGVDWEFVRPAGGPSLWVRIPGVRTDRMALRARDAGVPVAPGSSFEVVSGSAGDRVRIPFYMPPQQMELGIKVVVTQAL